jgi:hypothetical protein
MFRFLLEFIILTGIAASIYSFTDSILLRTVILTFIGSIFIIYTE